MHAESSKVFEGEIHKRLVDARSVHLERGKMAEEAIHKRAGSSRIFPFPASENVSDPCSGDL